jgi:methionyl-tRNA formyltransferase
MNNANPLSVTSPISVAVAGSTERALWALERVLPDERFRLEWILTPEPKPIGRAQTISPNPLHQFGLDQQLPVVLVKKTLSDETRAELEQLPQPDILLVIDFGYLVPSWLLKLPKLAPLNIHPSTLPSWRGSSPGQFVLLYGETESAISLIIMNELLDQGAIVYQKPFAVQPDWTQTDYYRESFKLISEDLPELLSAFAAGRLKPQPQPLDSPTPIARRLKKENAFIPWELIVRAMAGDHLPDRLDFDPEVAQLENLPPLLRAVYAHYQDSGRSLPHLIERATKAFSPWPQLWTVVKTDKGDKRMKILSAKVEGGDSRQGATQNTKLVLKEVQIEGKNPALWKELKNQIRFEGNERELL